MGTIRKKYHHKRHTLRAEKILENRQLSEGVHVISFERRFNFLAGQVVAVSLDHGNEPRLYSIASGENDPVIEILFKVEPGGLLTPHLARCKPGDPILVSEPFGEFTDYSQPASWIATGTGIAPFRSMLRSGKTTSQTRIIYGGRQAESFYFHDELLVLGENYIACSSTNETGSFFSGRLTRYLSEVAEFRKSEKFLLCGSSEMVVAVRDLLISKGVAFEQIVSEIYF